MKCCAFIIDNTESHKKTQSLFCFWVREIQMSQGAEIQELRHRSGSKPDDQTDSFNPPSEVLFFYEFIHTRHNLPRLSWDLSEFIRLFSWCYCNLQMLQQQLRFLLTGLEVWIYFTLEPVDDLFSWWRWSRRAAHSPQFMQQLVQ